MMRNLRLLWIALGILAMPMFASAQTPNESLLIGPGDTVHVLVFEAPELEQVAKVTDTGEVRLTLGGTVNLMGVTPPAAADRIEERLKVRAFLLNPHVTVSVQHYATENVSVFGQVRAPGAYPIDTPRSLIEVLSLAGGLTDLAERNVTVRHHATGQEVKFFVSNDARIALREVPSVYPGDTVLVERGQMVYFLGDVGHPGGYVNTTNQARITALRALSLAGGTPPNAVPSHARLIRRGADETYTETTINLSAMQKGKQSDLLLQEGDIVYVPFSYIRNVAVNLSSLVAAATAAAVYQF
jgi:polysaccharide biosynthesis/export protein